MKQIIIPAQLACLEAVMDFITPNMHQEGLDSGLQNELALVVEEIFVNIASYAYPSGKGDVSIRFSIDSEKVIMEFSDSGVPYDPLAKEDPDITLSIDEREIGGLGVYLVKKIMDHVEYRYEDCKNILFMEKFLL